jgi:hypothetical protein
VPAARSTEAYLALRSSLSRGRQSYHSPRTTPAKVGCTCARAGGVAACEVVGGSAVRVLVGQGARRFTSFWVREVVVVVWARYSTASCVRLGYASSRLARRGDSSSSSSPFRKATSPTCSAVVPLTSSPSAASAIAPPANAPRCRCDRGCLHSVVIRSSSGRESVRVCGRSIDVATDEAHAGREQPDEPGGEP